MRRPSVASCLVLLLITSACQKAEKGKVTPAAGSGSAAGSAGSGAVAPPTPGPAEDLDSKDILTRSETSPAVQVKHILIGWRDLAQAYGGHMDPRAQKRSNAEAAKLAKEMKAKLEAIPAGDTEALNTLIKANSEDPGSQSGEPYDVKSDTPFVPEFKQLALRLRLNEVGIVKTNYGYHVMIRVPSPPPDPLESADILARPPETTGSVQIQHVLIGWKGAPAARSATRAKAEADKLATDVLAKVKAGGDMAKLMKEFSEDPGSKDTGKPYEVTPDSPMVEPFKNMALRLKIGEAGLVKSPFGWHVMKRVPPPPPDSLESTDILKREPTTQKAKVKHILLGWTETHAEDERGKKRTRAELEKLVKATVAKLKGGAKIEPLMKELSEDPGSAASGNSYDATPDAGLVAPFKNLSLRLKVGEVGVVKTDFGIHIIQRVE